MNNTVKCALIFMGGALTGGVVTFLSVKEYFQLKADLEIEQVRAAYDRRMEEVDPVKSSEKGEIEGPSQIHENERVPINSERSYLTKALNNKPPMKDYTKMFKETSKEELELREVVRDPSEVVDEAELESPPDDEPYDEEEDMVETENLETYRLNVEHEKALKENRAPYEIELSDFELTCVHYRKETLHYYISDDLLTTDEDEAINPEDVIGNCLVSTGFSGDKRDIMYVRNDIMMVDYEVEKVFNTFNN